MIENYDYFNVLLAFNFMDFVMLYAIVHSFGVSKFDLSKKQLIRDVLIGISYGMAMGSIQYFNDRGFFYRFTGFSLLIILTMWLAKRKIVDGIILVSILFLFASTIQMIFFFSLKLLFELRDETLTLTMHLLTTVTIIFLCLKVRFYNMFLLIQQKMYLKIGSFLLFTIVNASLIVLDFNNDSELEQMVGIIVFFSIIFCGIITTFITAQEKIDQSSDKYHDVVNMFNGLYLSMESEDSMDELKEQMRNIKEFLTGKEVMGQFESGNHVKNLEALLYETLEKENKDNELILDLGYFVAHEKVLFGQLILMLGTLFDNALEHGGDHPIFIELNVSQRIFELTMKNSCEQLSEKQMKKMFKKGYTTKELVGTGKGLYNLEREVKKHQDVDFNAMITTSCDYNEEYKSYYLSVTIDITHKALALH